MYKKGSIPFDAAKIRVLLQFSKFLKRKKMNRNMDSPSLRFTLFKSGSNRITSWRQPQL